jgi:class 3 adenylate cyclase
VSGASLYRGLCVKILAIPTIVFVIGVAVPGVMAYRLLQVNAEREIRHSAQAIHRALLGSGELPAKEKGAAPYRFRRAVTSSSDTANRPDPYETQLIASFQADKNLKRIEGEVAPEGKSQYVIATPIIASEDRKPLPAGKGKPQTDTGWKKGQVIGVSALYVPAGEARAQASLIYQTTFRIVALLAFLCAALLLWRTYAMVVKPMNRLLETSKAIRRGDWGAKFHARFPDEIASLTHSLQETTLWLRERVAREEKLRAMFQQFVPASVAARALGKDSDKIIAGTRHSVSVMIINIRNFKLLMEHLPPEETVTTLNEFFSEVNQVIVSHKGVVSKYLGDTVMCVFGMPLGNEDHALLAVRAAIAVPRALQNLYVRLEENFGWELGVGIGIATGEPIVGHFGSSEHMEYTVLGEVVVDAHQLEKMTKSVPEEDTILVDEPTYRMVMSDVHVYDLGEKQASDGRTLHPYVVQGLRSEARSVLAA